MSGLIVPAKLVESEVRKIQGSKLRKLRLTSECPFINARTALLNFAVTANTTNAQAGLQTFSVPASGDDGTIISQSSPGGELSKFNAITRAMSKGVWKITLTVSANDCTVDLGGGNTSPGVAGIFSVNYGTVTTEFPTTLSSPATFGSLADIWYDVYTQGFGGTINTYNAGFYPGGNAWENPAAPVPVPPLYPAGAPIVIEFTFAAACYFALQINWSNASEGGGANASAGLLNSFAVLAQRLS
jgi:hypothetical protein